MYIYITPYVYVCMIRLKTSPEGDVLVLLDAWHGDLRSWDGNLNGSGQVLSTTEFGRLMLEFDVDDRGPPPKYEHGEPGRAGEDDDRCCVCPC